MYRDHHAGKYIGIDAESLTNFASAHKIEI